MCKCECMHECVSVCVSQSICVSVSRSNCPRRPGTCRGDEDNSRSLFSPSACPHLPPPHLPPPPPSWGLGLGWEGQPGSGGTLLTGRVAHSELPGWCPRGTPLAVLGCGAAADPGSEHLSFPTGVRTSQTPVTQGSFFLKLVSISQSCKALEDRFDRS